MDGRRTNNTTGAGPGQSAARTVAHLRHPEADWIDVPSVHDHFIVKVRASRESARSNGCDCGAPRNDVTLLHHRRATVSVSRGHPTRVLDLDQQAKCELATHETDAARRWRRDDSSGWGG